MRAAAVLDRHHPAVGGGELVAADAETGLQGAGQREVETAAATVRRRLLGHRAVRPEVALVPPLGGLGPAEPGEHPHPAEAEFEGDLLDLRIAGVGVAGHQPGVVRRGRQQVAGAEVTRLQPLAPRHPGRRQQRAVTRQQHHLGDARLTTGRPHHGDRPVPADVAGQRGREGVGGGVLALGPYPEMYAHLGARAAGLGDADVGAGQLHRGRPGLLDRGSDGLVDGCGVRRRVHVAIVASGQHKISAG